MWIRCTNPGTWALYSDDIPGMEDKVVFGDSRTARVRREVGEALCEQFPSIVPKKEEKSDAD